MHISLKMGKNTYGIKGSTDKFIHYHYINKHCKSVSDTHTHILSKSIDKKKGFNGFFVFLLLYIGLEMLRCKCQRDPSQISDFDNWIFSCLFTCTEIVLFDVFISETQFNYFFVLVNSSRSYTISIWISETVKSVFLFTRDSMGKKLFSHFFLMP